MRAIRLEQHGGPDVMRLAEIPEREPGAGEIRIRHRAIGINYIDTYQRSGLYTLKMPTGLGLEAAGTVDAVGPGVSRFKTGDRVGYCTGPLGAYAESNVVPEGRAVKLPDTIDDATAAAALLKGMTAQFLLRRVFPVGPGQTILFHAAAGGVGTIATAWAKHLGATVIGTVGSPAKAEIARAHGCDHTIDYTREDFVARTREITGGAGVPVAYDSVGKATLLGSLDCLARRGMLVAFGNASGPADPLDILLLSRKGSLFVTRPVLFDYIATTEELDATAAELFAAIASGVVHIEVNQRFALADAAEAHRALEGRRTTGATILIP